MALKYNTIYSELAIQSLVIETVKRPILEAVPVIFNPDTTKIAKLKAASKLWRALQAMSRLPQPTIENTWHPNSHNLIRLRDWIKDSLNLNRQRMTLIDKLFLLVIWLYDSDPPWRWIMDSVKDEAFKMDWKPRGYGDDWTDGYNWWDEKELK